PLKQLQLKILHNDAPDIRVSIQPKSRAKGKLKAPRSITSFLTPYLRTGLVDQKKDELAVNHTRNLLLHRYPDIHFGSSRINNSPSELQAYSITALRLPAISHNPHVYTTAEPHTPNQGELYTANQIPSNELITCPSYTKHFPTSPPKASLTSQVMSDHAISTFNCEPESQDTRYGSLRKEYTFIGEPPSKRLRETRELEEPSIVEFDDKPSTSRSSK
ncbi:carotenoid ester lipase, partial [Moniliophthora roreri]